MRELIAATGLVILLKIGPKSSIFRPVWPWNLMDDIEKTIGHLFFPISSFVHHFKAIGEVKVELQSGNAQFGQNRQFFLAVWPCNFTCDVEKQ